MTFGPIITFSYLAAQAAVQDAPDRPTAVVR
jgi:hypothetical protein